MPQFVSRSERREVKHEVISHRNHPLIKRVRALHMRDAREYSHVFTLEGIRFVLPALEVSDERDKVLLDTLLFCPSLFPNTWSWRLVHNARKSGVLCVEVTPDVLHSVAQNDDPQGLVGVARQQWQTLETIDAHHGLCWLVLDTIQSSGNLGTILRTSEASGGAGLILLGREIDPYNSAGVRASMAAIFNQTLVRTTQREFMQWKTRRNCCLIGTALQASDAYDAINYLTPTLLWMGGERKGLSVQQQQQCDRLVRIPMTGRSDSLNVAVATGIMLYEVLRQRRAQVVA
jgi:TrmH family RNA methyltransferase